jgi:hypothetical protein
MLKLLCSSTLLLTAATLGCRPESKSNADTAIADTTSATVPAITAGPSDSASTPAAGSAGGSKSTTKKSSKAKAAARSTRRNSNNAQRDTGILGYDSVIRFPHRVLPTATSTPTRK